MGDTTPMSNGDLLNIGTFSMLTRLTPKALRFYEERGLLVPARKEITGYRFYGYDQVGRGLLLRRLSDLGFGVQDMRSLLDVIDGRADRSAVRAVIEARVQQVRAQSKELERIRGVLENSSFEEVLDMSQDIPKIVDAAPMRILSRRDKGAYHDVIPRLMGELCAVLGSPNQTARACGPPMTIYHDVEFKETDADIEIAIPISGRITVDPPFEVRTMPGGRVVTAIHQGPYNMVGEAWGRVFKFVQENGLRPTGLCREFYMNDPAETPEAELLTEVQQPVE